MKVLDEFVQECRKKLGEKLLSIVLFGSQARGTATQNSDLDLLVVLKNLPKNDPLKDLRMKLQMKHKIKIDVLFISERDFKANASLPSPLFSSLSLGFKVIYDRMNTIAILRNMFSELSKRNIIYYEGRKKWNLSERSSKILL